MRKVISTRLSKVWKWLKADSVNRVHAETFNRREKRQSSVFSLFRSDLISRKRKEKLINEKHV